MQFSGIGTPNAESTNVEFAPAWPLVWDGSGSLGLRLAGRSEALAVGVRSSAGSLRLPTRVCWQHAAVVGSALAVAGGGCRCAGGLLLTPVVPTRAGRPHWPAARTGWA